MAVHWNENSFLLLEEKKKVNVDCFATLESGLLLLP
jgi:hypothetical protein